MSREATKEARRLHLVELFTRRQKTGRPVTVVTRDYLARGDNSGVVMTTGKVVGVGVAVKGFVHGQYQVVLQLPDSPLLRIVTLSSIIDVK